MKNIKLIIKGFIMGIANIIPGVSGGTLAITLGIYEDLIKAISHFFSNFKKNIKFLIPLVIGMVLALIIGSKVISFTLDKYTLCTILFFAGLILGGVPLLYKKVKGKFKLSNLLVFLVTFIAVISLSYIKSGSDVSLTSLNIFGYLLLFLIGVIAAGTMIIPGISGSFVLMVLGYYEPIINTINDLTRFNNIIDNILILVPFGLGVLVGIVALAKLIEYLFKKHETKTYYAILGFVTSSVVGIFMNTTNLIISPLFLIIGLILFAIGFVIAYKLGE